MFISRQFFPLISPIWQMHFFASLHCLVDLPDIVRHFSRIGKLCHTFLFFIAYIYAQKYNSTNTYQKNYLIKLYLIRLSTTLIIVWCQKQTRITFIIPCTNDTDHKRRNMLFRKVGIKIVLYQLYCFWSISFKICVIKIKWHQFIDMCVSRQKYFKNSGAAGVSYTKLG